MLYNFLVLEIDIITFCVFIFLKFLLGMYCVIMMSCFFYSYIEQFRLFFIINVIRFLIICESSVQKSSASNVLNNRIDATYTLVTVNEFCLFLSVFATGEKDPYLNKEIGRIF